MKIAFVGKSGAGKSILFDLLRQEKNCHDLPQGGRLITVPLPDERLIRLVEALSPKKYKGVEINLIDPGVGFRVSSQNIADADVLCLIIKGGALEELKEIIDALSNRDRDIVEKKLQGLESELKKRHGDEKLQKEYQLMQKLDKVFAENLLLNQLSFSQEELKILGSYQLLTLKKLLLIINQEGKDIDMGEDFKKCLATFGIPYISINIGLHFEISQLELEERGAYYKEYNLDEKEVENLLKFIYNASGYITFYTIVGDEIRAWALRKGDTVLQAAGKIHTDMAKGFIKAEVISFEDFYKSEFSLPNAKENGLMRLESKDYIVQDGDIVYIRFKV